MALMLALLLAIGCWDSQERLERQLVELRTERTELVDGLHQEFSQGSFASELDEATAGGEMEFIGGLAREVERETLESNLRLLGSGEHVPTFSKRGREFYAREDVRVRAVELVQMDREIERTEAKLGERRDAP